MELSWPAQTFACYISVYSTTLCISAFFAVARCPSVTLVDCIHMVEDIIKLLRRPGSPIILVFEPSTGTQFQEEPLQRGLKIQGKWENLAIEIAVYLGNGILDRPMVAMERYGSHMRSIEWWHFQWPWRTPNLVFKVMAFLKSNISKMVRLGIKLL